MGSVLTKGAMEKQGFTKEESMALKGIAIFLMIFHHCFLAPWCYTGFEGSFFPLAEEQLNRLAALGGICVGILAFISGYGLSMALERHQGSAASFCIQRYVRFMRKFWPVLAICLLAGVVIDNHTAETYLTGGPLDALYNLLIQGLGMSYLFGTPMFVHEWWYLSANVVFILLTPVFVALVERYGWAVPLFLLITIPRVTGAGFGHPICGFSTTLLLGIIFNRYQLFDRIETLLAKKLTGAIGQSLKAVTALLVLFFSYKMYIVGPGAAYDEIHAALIPLLFIIVFKECVLCYPYIRHIFAFLGKHSINMYLIHTVLSGSYLHTFLFSMPWFMLTPLAVCAVSLLFSIVLEWTKSKVRKTYIAISDGTYNFLFQVYPDPSWSKKQRSRFWTWNLLSVLVSGLILGLLALLLAPGPGNADIARSLLHNFKVVTLNTLPVAFLTLILYALTRRAWIAFSINAVFVLTLSAVNYFKLMLRDDPLLFSDLLLIKEAGNIVGNYKLSLDLALGMVLICAVTVAIVLYFLVRGRPKGWGRLPLITFFVGILGLGILIPALMDTGLYRSIHADIGELTKEYVSRGFVYPFVHSITDAVPPPPPVTVARRLRLC